MNKKTTAAVAAAVFEYIRSEEEAVCLQAAAGGGPAARASGPAAPARLWGVSGRQQQMELRGLMQLRAFAGARLR